jgi:hypothetical protein
LTESLLSVNGASPFSHLLLSVHSVLLSVHGALLSVHSALPGSDLLFSVHSALLSTGNLKLKVAELLIHSIHSLPAFAELAAC